MPRMTVSILGSPAMISLRAAGAGLVGGLLVLCPHPAAAQDAMFKRGENVGVLERPRPGYEALGIRAGGFIVYPSLTLRAEYDDNLFARPEAESDTIITTTPSLEVRSDWGRHAVTLSADANLKRHDRFKSEDTDTWSVVGQGRLDVSRDTTLGARASFADRVEPRTTASSAVESVEPIQYQVQSANLIATHQFSRVKLVGRAELARYDYQDGRDLAGGVIDEDYRDHSEIDVRAKAAYAHSPSTAFFAELGAQQMNYERSAGPNRDSDGITALAGVDLEITRLITGEFSVGYLHQSFNDPAYEDISNPHYRMRIDWYPTPLITVGLTATQRVSDSSLAEAPAFLARTVEVKADYELLRNLIISGQIHGADEDYRGIDRRDRRYGASLSANYLVNRTVGVSMRYKFETLNSSGVSRGRDFDDQSISLALVFQR